MQKCPYCKRRKDAQKEVEKVEDKEVRSAQEKFKKDEKQEKDAQEKPGKEKRPAEEKCPKDDKDAAWYVI